MTMFWFSAVMMIMSVEDREPWPLLLSAMCAAFGVFVQRFEEPTR